MLNRRIGLGITLLAFISLLGCTPEVLQDLIGKCDLAQTAGPPDIEGYWMSIEVTSIALREAAALNPPASSIAMPVFASGNGRFDFEQGLNIMLDELTRPGTPVPQKVVLFTRHPEQANLAARILKERLGDTG